MDQPDPSGGSGVPEEELAAIRRQLRATLGEPDTAPPQPPPPPPRRARLRDPGRSGPATITLRFVGGFVAPGLLLVAIVLVERLLG